MSDVWYINVYCVFLWWYDRENQVLSVCNCTDMRDPSCMINTLLKFPAWVIVWNHVLNCYCMVVQLKKSFDKYDHVFFLLNIASEYEGWPIFLLFKSKRGISLSFCIKKIIEYVSYQIHWKLRASNWNSFKVNILIQWFIKDKYQCSDCFLNSQLGLFVDETYFRGGDCQQTDTCVSVVQ